MLDPPICPYCQQPSEEVTGKEIYSHRPDLHFKKFYRCEPCSAWVGCHTNKAGPALAGKPMGNLSNESLRQLKQEAHAAFDPIWKQGRMVRSTAYGWLARALMIPKSECHIGLFDEMQCKRVTAICREYKKAHL